MNNEMIKKPDGEQQVEFPEVKVGQCVMYNPMFEQYQRAHVYRVYREGFEIAYPSCGVLQIHRYMKDKWNNATARQITFLHHPDGRPVMKNHGYIGWHLIYTIIGIVLGAALGTLVR